MCCPVVIHNIIFQLTSRESGNNITIINSMDSVPNILNECDITEVVVGTGPFSNDRTTNDYIYYSEMQIQQHQ